MSQTDLHEVLQFTLKKIRDIRRTVAAAGNAETLSDIDNLLGVASEETRRRLGMLERLNGGAARSAASPSDDLTE
jgi:hypothetical protein